MYSGNDRELHILHDSLAEWRQCNWSLRRNTNHLLLTFFSYDDFPSYSFLENGVWDLQDVHAEKHTHYYACCPEPYPELAYSLVLKRRSAFYVAYLIVPCVFLSALSLLVFYLPAECGEKLTLAITNLLALVVFQQLVAESMPPSGDDPPLLGMFLSSVK